jgi:hypothetical protein
MTMMKSVLAAAALAFAVPTVAATPLPVNADWSTDTLEIAGDPTVLSPWTFTVTKNATFYLVDCCVVGDVWTVSGDIAGVSSFYAGGALPATLSPLAVWSSADWSKLTIGVGPGTYTFSITGDGAGGLPAGVFLAVAEVPEPATWAMLIAGFGLVGATLRRRTAVTA